MGLFYPTTFGIVGQKMTSLQYRSQGDSEDPHDEHYLLATQSKQEQVTHRSKTNFCRWLSGSRPCSLIYQFSTPVLQICFRPEGSLQTGWGFGWRYEWSRRCWGAFRPAKGLRQWRDAGGDGAWGCPGGVPYGGSRG